MATPTQTRPLNSPFLPQESENGLPNIDVQAQTESRLDTNNAWSSFLDVKESNITRLDTTPEPPKHDDSEKIAEAKRVLEALLQESSESADLTNEKTIDAGISKDNGESADKAEDSPKEGTILTPEVETPKVETNIKEIPIENKSEYLASFGIYDKPQNTVKEAKASTEEGKIVPKTKESGNIFGGIMEVALDIKNHIDFKMLYNETKTFFGAIWELITGDVLSLGEKNKPKDEKAMKAEEEKKAKEAKKNSVIRRFYDALTKPAASVDRKLRSQQQIEDLNRKLGINSAYEGIMNPDGTLRADLEAYLAMENSKKTEEQIQAQKRRQVSTASSGGKKGPGVIFDLNKSAESHNSVTQLKG